MNIKTAEEMKKIVEVNAERDAQLHFERFLKQFSAWNPGTKLKFRYNPWGQIKFLSIENVPPMTESVFDKFVLKVEEHFEPLGYSVVTYIPYLELTFR